MDRLYDYIIVGGGTAGCVVATMLIEQTNSTVLLLEAGPNDNMIQSKIPVGMPDMMAKHLWKYQTEVEKSANNRCLAVPQGKILGGGSSVNGMVYMRGCPQDYQDWVNRYGCDGWGYDDVLAAYLATENNEILAGKYHADEGYQYVSENRFRHTLNQTFIKAGQQLGYQYLNDFNAEQQQGVGFFQTTTHQGRRASTSYSFLQRIINNPRFILLTEAVTQKVCCDNGRATGVDFIHNNKQQHANSNQEVIISSGAIGSPKLLMLSGIGPAEHLAELGIDLQLDAPAVGENYQDHLHVNLRAELKEPLSIISYSSGWKKYVSGLQWLLFKTGIGVSNILEGCGLFDLDNDGRIETQIHSFPLVESFGQNGEAAAVEGMTLKLGHLYPESRGQIRLRSNNVADLPLIYGHYLSAAGDIDAKVRAVRFGLQFFETPAMQKIIKTMMMPIDQQSSDDEIAYFVRDTATTVFHPVGTCAMGSDEHKSVLDTQLRVRGMKNLRVIDGSAFPHIVSGNTNAPVIMLAYKGAQMLLAAKNS